MPPRISVIMPVYNCEPYVREAISSILNQTFTEFELIVCDDGSSDKTWEVIQSFDDNRIQKFRNKENQGYLKTYNFLLTKINGEFVTCQDGDDWSLPTRLEEQAAVLDSHPDVSLCGCNGTYYYDEKTQYPCAPYADGYVILGDRNFQFILAAIMYRVTVLAEVPGFHAYFDKLTSMDQYFILDILSHFKGYAINRYLYCARFNPTSNHRTLTSLRKLTAHEAYLLLRKQRIETGSDWLMEGSAHKLLKFEEGLMQKRSFIAEKFREFAVYKIDSGNLRDASALLWSAWKKNPFLGRSYRTLFYGLRKFLGIR